MRRGSMIYYYKFNSTNVNNNINNSLLINSKPLFSHKSGGINKKLMIKNNLLKDPRINNNKINIIDKTKKNIAINVTQNNYKNKKHTYNKFIYFRKYIFKNTILNKYTSPYLELDCNKDEIYLNESQKPKMFYVYIINYLLQSKKCKLFSLYTEMLNFIDGNDYIIYYYNIKQCYSIIKYLLGCIYNKDKYTYNKTIDDNNNYERIIINYKNTIDNILDLYNNKYKTEQFSFMINQYISKLNIKDYVYYFNFRIYKYLFIKEIPPNDIPFIKPNYLGFDSDVYMILKKFMQKYKYRKIKTDYYKYLESEAKKMNKTKENKNKYMHKLQEESFEEKDDNEIENSLFHNHHNNDMKKRSKKSLYYNNRQLYKNNSSFYSLESHKDYSSSSYSDSQSNKNDSKKKLFFIKYKISNKDKRIENDTNILEVEKILAKFKININKKDKNKNQVKSKSINLKHQEFINGNKNKNNQLLINDIYKYLDTEEKLKNINNRNTQIIEKKPLNNRCLKNDINFPDLRTNTSKNEQKIDSYNQKPYIINNSNIKKFNKNNNSSNNSKSLSLSYRKRNRVLQNNNNKNRLLDFKNKILELITKDNYTSYNRKYNNCNIKNKRNIKENISKIVMDNIETNSSLEKNKTYKKTIDFFNDLQKKKIELNNDNKLISNVIVEAKYNKEYYYRKTSKLKKYRTYTYEKNIKNNIEDDMEYILNKLSFMNNKIKKNARNLNFKRNTFFKNARTSKEIIKYGDIYF